MFQNRTHFFAFYSFKGGVGRSMALINTAAHLARRERRVLAIDLDLEAPGISYLSAQSEADLSTPGFVDAIYEVLNTPETSALIQEPPEHALQNFIRPLNLKVLAQGEDAGVITIMPAGRLTDTSAYQKRLAEIDFARLYREGVGVRVLEHFKHVIESSQQFDYVLVDSRTGLATEAGIAVRDLADHLIVVMGLNHQNVTGTVDFLRLLRSGEPRPRTMTPVLSPMPLGEDDLAENRIAVAEKQLRSVWPESTKWSLPELQIPYHPRLALQETPHIARLTTQALTQAYKKLERHIRTLAEDTPDHYLQQAQKLLNEREWSDAIAPIRELIRFDYPTARLLLQQALREHSGVRAFDAYAEMLKNFAASAYDAAVAAARHYADSNRMATAEKILRRFIATHPGDWTIWDTLAHWWLRKAKRPAEANRVYSEAITKLPENSALRGNYAIFLWHACGDADRARPHYQFALDREQNDANTLGNHALFVWTADGDIPLARDYFQRALELDPFDNNIHSNFAELLIADGQLDLAESHLREAWRLRGTGHKFIALETLYRAGLFCLITKRSDSGVLRQLMSQLTGKFEGEFVTFDRILEATGPKIAPDDHKMYAAIGAVLSRKSRPSSLREFPRWRSLKPLEYQDDLFAEAKIRASR